MTREEARYLLNNLRAFGKDDKDDEAIDMAIEALAQPIVCKDYRIDDDHIYCSPKVADRVVKALQTEVVRCKDCRWWNGSQETMHNNHLCRNWSKFGSINTRADDFCSYGESKGGDDE